jgi:hypothetical protein
MLRGLGRKLRAYGGDPRGCGAPFRTPFCGIDGAISWSGVLLSAVSAEYVLSLRGRSGRRGCWEGIRGRLNLVEQLVWRADMRSGVLLLGGWI